MVFGSFGERVTFSNGQLDFVPPSSQEAAKLDKNLSAGQNDAMPVPLSAERIPL